MSATGSRENLLNEPILHQNAPTDLFNKTKESKDQSAELSVYNTTQASLFKTGKKKTLSQ